MNSSPRALLSEVKTRREEEVFKLRDNFDTKTTTKKSAKNREGSFLSPTFKSLK